MESSSDWNLEDIRARVAEIGAALGARAAGYWQLDQHQQRLVQISFVPGVGLDPEVGRQFAAATEMVALSQTSLGIVAAALTGQPAISHAADLPADSGSGRWLRAFGASRSVAVPSATSMIRYKASFPWPFPPDCQLDDQAVVAILRESEVG